VHRVVTIKVVPLREGHRSTPLPSIAPTRCRRWCRSRCAECETEPLSPGATGRSARQTYRSMGGEGSARRRQRARWSPSESRIAVRTESTRVEWRRSSTPRRGERAKPARRGTAGPRNGIDGRNAWVGPTRDRRSPSVSGGTGRRADVSPDDTRMGLPPPGHCARGIRPVERPIDWPLRDRPAPGSLRPPSGCGRVASGCRSLLVHCLPWQRRNRHITIPPLCGGVRPFPP